jgi:integrase
MNGRMRITKRVVDALKPSEITWDTEVRGFGVRCQRRDKVYVLKARVHGRQRWFSIGPHGSPWTVGMARSEARRILGEIASKKDPATARDAEKANPTVEDLAAMFLQEHVRTKRKISTAEFCRDILERIVVPRLGRIRVADVTHSDVAQLHHSLRRTPYQANRVLAVVSKMFNWAEPKGYRDPNANPCRHVEKNPEKGRERFLSDDELVRLADVLNEMEHESDESPYIIAAVRMLIFTGARRGEILNLEWSHVDIGRALLLLPDSKTGQKAIYLSPPALEVLANLPRQENNPYVICGGKPGEHLVNLTKPWGRIRKKADLEDVRLHDLRHSFASVAASGGLSLPMIGKLLGHTQAQTTQRYSHLAADPVRAANEAIGLRIAAVMEGGAEGGEVVPMPKRGA